jgi:hypothetical protein
MEREKEYQLRNFFFSRRRRRRRRRRKNYSFSIQSGLECVCMFVSWRGDLLRSSTARVFFSKFIEDVCVCVYIYRPCQQQNLFLALFFFFFSGQHGEKRKRKMLGGSGGGGGFSAAITAAVIPLFIGCAIAGDGRSFDVQCLDTIARGTPYFVGSPMMSRVFWKGRIENRPI